MSAHEGRFQMIRPEGRPRRFAQFGRFRNVGLGLAAVLAAMIGYNACKIEIPSGHQAVLIRRTGRDLTPDQELAPPPENGRYSKGVQAGGPNESVLTEGRYFYNPFNWDWEIRPQFEVPNGKMGVRIALHGDELPAGGVLAGPGQKGIRPGVLKPGRYPYNSYAESIELHEPIAIPAGFRGVVTLLAGREPKDSNVVLVGAGERGTQSQTLEPGTYYQNPYEARISLIDCRSRRFNLGEETAMDFLSADGFPVVIDGAVEFRVVPERAAEVFVLYNEDENGDEIDQEIINKIITPESRSICRIGGSKLTGGQFISGDDREQFQRNLVKSLTENCKRQGIEILAVAITSIQPPEEIAGPVRDREVAKQQLAQFVQERLQQVSEAQLKVQVILADQKRKMVEAEQGVVEQTTRAQQDQQVANTLASQQLQVAETRFEAARDKASAIVAKAEADAEVIRFNNTAELSGLAARVEAFDGDGSALARNVLIEKLAPAFRTILSNSDGPLMELFGQFARPDGSAAKPRSTAPPTSASAEAPLPSTARAAELPRDPFTPAEARP